MRISLPIKLMASYLLVVGLLLGPSVWHLRSALVGSLEQVRVHELEGRLEELRDRLSRLPDEELDPVVRDYARLVRLRVTVVRADGVVIADSEVANSLLGTLGNHGDRPEVKVALAGNFGFTARNSATLGRELLYAALPLSGASPPRGVVRVSTEVEPVGNAVGQALKAQRLATGLGLSAAIGLCFGAALFVSWPLRRMRDAARAFSQSRWVRVERVRTGDELEDLSVALDELGRKLGAQLVEVGAQEALLAQAVRSLATPALVLSPLLEPVHINGAFRRWASVDAAREPERMSALANSPRLRAAQAEALRTGLPTEMSLTALDFKSAPQVVSAPVAGDVKAAALGEAELGETRAELVPLARPGAPPLWLLLVEPGAPATEAEGPHAVHRHLGGAERIVEQLWITAPELRASLARLRLRLDEAADAAGPMEPVSVEPVPAALLVERAVEEMRVLYPERAERIDVDLEETRCPVAESAGMAARAVRRLLGESLRVLPPGRTLTLTLHVEAAHVVVSVDGAAPSDLEPIRRLARALGADAGRVPSREKEAAWLGLPRA